MIAKRTREGLATCALRPADRRRPHLLIPDPLMPVSVTDELTLPPPHPTASNATFLAASEMLLWCTTPIACESISGIFPDGCLAPLKIVAWNIVPRTWLWTAGTETASAEATSILNYMATRRLVSMDYRLGVCPITPFCIAWVKNPSSERPSRADQGWSTRGGLALLT